MVSFPLEMTKVYSATLCCIEGLLSENMNVTLERLLLKYSLKKRRGIILKIQNTYRPYITDKCLVCGNKINQHKSFDILDISNVKTCYVFHMGTINFHFWAMNLYSETMYIKMYGKFITFTGQISFNWITFASPLSTSWFFIRISKMTENIMRRLNLFTLSKLTWWSKNILIVHVFTTLFTAKFIFLRSLNDYSLVIKDIYTHGMNGSRLL